MKFASTENILNESIKNVDKNKINLLAFKTKNFGDLLISSLIEKITNKSVHTVDINLSYRWCLEEKYSKINLLLGIGSTLHFAPKNSVILGSGSIRHNSFPKINQ